MSKAISPKQIDEVIFPAVKRLAEAGFDGCKLAVQTGSGQKVFSQIAEIANCPLDQLAGMPITTAKGHEGCFRLLKLESAKFIHLSGRLHFYEGYEGWEVCLPVYALRKLGVEVLLLCNASGAISQDLQVGDIVIVSDFIDLSGANPLRGIVGDDGSARFVDVNKLPSTQIEPHILDAFAQLGLEVKSGVYAMVTGPRYETRAEIEVLRRLGADLVGMSTIPEAITAKSLNMKVAILSLVTNQAWLTSPTHEEVLKASNRFSPKLSALLESIARRILEEM